MALSGAERARRYRARKREARAAEAVARQRIEVARDFRLVAPGESPPVQVRDQADTDPRGIEHLAEWARSTLRVPPGHPLAGEPMTVPDYGLAFLQDAVSHRTSLFCCARKNSKSGIVAVYVLARLIGPLRVDGWRGGVVSVTRDKAGELKAQIQAIALASGLAGRLKFRRVGFPSVESASGSLDILAADKSAGHASGFDDAIIDELGLLGERDRELVNGMRSSTSARDGRYIALTIHGDGPFVPELLDRRADPAVAVHHYQAPEGCALDDEAAWHGANPGLADGIKSLAYMRDSARYALASPADQRDFRLHELNQPVAASREMVCDPGDWAACEVPDAELPARDGACVVGFDLGGPASMTALVALWPSTGRLEAYGAFPAEPDLAARGRRDGVGREYELMRDRGELGTYPGRTTDVGRFIGDCAERLAGEHVTAAGADRFRKSEALDALAAAGLSWPMAWRGQGASASADGSHDVRAFQRRILGGRIRSRKSLLMRRAIAGAVLRFDGSGNPALDKAGGSARIDAVSAAVIACGLAELVPAAGGFAFE